MSSSPPSFLHVDMDLTEESLLPSACGTPIVGGSSRIFQGNLQSLSGYRSLQSSPTNEFRLDSRQKRCDGLCGRKCGLIECPWYAILYTNEKIQDFAVLTDLQYQHVCAEGLQRENKCRHPYSTTISCELPGNTGYVSSHLPFLEPFACCYGQEVVPIEKLGYRDACWLKTGVSNVKGKHEAHAHVTPRFLRVLEELAGCTESIGEYSSIEIARLVNLSIEVLRQTTHLVIERDYAYLLQVSSELLLHSATRTQKIAEQSRVNEYTLSHILPAVKHITQRTHFPTNMRNRAPTVASLAILPYHTTYHACDRNAHHGDPVLVQEALPEDHIPFLVYQTTPIIAQNVLAVAQRMDRDVHITYKADPVLWLLWQYGDLPTLQKSTHISMRSTSLLNILLVLDTASFQEQEDLLRVSLYDFLRVFLVWQSTKEVSKLFISPNLTFPELALQPATDTSVTISPTALNTALQTMSTQLQSIPAKHSNLSLLCLPGNIMRLAELYGNNKVTLASILKLAQNMRLSGSWQRLEALSLPLLHSDHSGAAFALLPNLTSLSRRFARGQVLSGILLTSEQRAMDQSYSSVAANTHTLPVSFGNLSILQTSTGESNALLELQLLCPSLHTLTLHGIQFNMSTAYQIAHFALLQHLDLAHCTVNSIYSMWPQRCLSFQRSINVEHTPLAQQLNFRTHMQAIFHDQQYQTSQQSPCILYSDFELQVQHDKQRTSTYTKNTFLSTPFLVNGIAVTASESTSSDIVAQSLAVQFHSTVILTVQNLQQASTVFNLYAPFTMQVCNALQCKHVLELLHTDKQHNIVKMNLNNVLVEPSKHFLTSLTSQYHSTVELPAAKVFSAERDVYNYIVQHQPRYLYAVQSTVQKHITVNALASILPLHVTEAAFNSCLQGDSAPDYSASVTVAQDTRVNSMKTPKNSVKKKKVKANYVRFEDDDGVLVPVPAHTRPKRVEAVADATTSRRLKLDESFEGDHSTMSIAGDIQDAISISASVDTVHSAISEKPQSVYIDMLLQDLNVAHYEEHIAIDKRLDEIHSKECEAVLAPHQIGEQEWKPRLNQPLQHVRDVIASKSRIYKVDSALAVSLEGTDVHTSAVTFLGTKIDGQKLHYKVHDGKTTVGNTLIPWQRMPLMSQLTILLQDNVLKVLQRDHALEYKYILHGVTTSRKCQTLSVSEPGQTTPSHILMLVLTCPCTQEHEDACFVNRWAYIQSQQVNKHAVTVFSAVPAQYCPHEPFPSIGISVKCGIVASKVLLQANQSKLKKTSTQQMNQPSTLTHHTPTSRFQDYPISLLLLFPMMLSVSVVTTNANNQKALVPSLQSYKDVLKQIYPGDSMLYLWVCALLSKVMQEIDQEQGKKILTAVNTGIHPYALSFLPLHVLAHSQNVPTAECVLHPSLDHQLYKHCPFVGVYTREFEANKAEMLSPHGQFMPGTDGDPVCMAELLSTSGTLPMLVPNKTDSLREQCPSLHDPLCHSIILFEKYVCPDCKKDSFLNLLLPCLSEEQEALFATLSHAALASLKAHATSCERANKTQLTNLSNRIYCNLFNVEMQFRDMPSLPMVSIDTVAPTGKYTQYDQQVKNLDVFRDLVYSDAITNTTLQELPGLLSQCVTAQQYAIGSVPALSPSKKKNLEITPGKGVFLIGNMEHIQTYSVTPVAVYAGVTGTPIYCYKVGNNRNTVQSSLSTLDVAASGQYLQTVCSIQGHVNQTSPRTEDAVDKWQKTVYPEIKRYITATPSYTHILASMQSAQRVAMYSRPMDQNVITPENGTFQHSILVFLKQLEKTVTYARPAMPSTPQEIIAAVCQTDNIDDVNNLYALSTNIELEQLDLAMIASVRGIVGSVHLASVGVRKSFQVVSPMTDQLTARVLPALTSAAILQPEFPAVPVANTICTVVLLNQVLFLITEEAVSNTQQESMKHPFYQEDEYDQHSQHRVPLSQDWMHALVHKQKAQERNSAISSPLDPIYQKKHALAVYNDVPIAKHVTTQLAVGMNTLLDVISTPMTKDVHTLTLIFGANPMFHTSIGNAVVQQITTTAMNAKKFLEKR